MTHWRVEDKNDATIWTIIEAESERDAAEGAFERDGLPSHSVRVHKARTEDLLEAAAYGKVDNVGGALREAREQLELSRAEIGRRFGFPVQTVEREGRANEERCASWEDWERGRYKPDREAVQQLAAIAEAIRGARNDQGAIDWNRLQSRLASRLDVDTTPIDG